MKKIIALAFILFAIVPSYAFTIQGTQYRIKGVIGSGNLLAGNSNKLKIVVGETSGKLESNHGLCIGFLCIPPETTNITIKGKLRYLNGTYFSNGKITVKLTYGLYSVSATNTTDSYGNFTVNIENVLKPVAESDFKIELVAEKNITASYTCQYNHTTGYCK